ncbi:MAG: GDSL-type esterase/lipase family protein [Oscillospiraceae bacterium]|jgi:lysophospholipase L1-like esterase|nr:GDSL-type esterase/lipase family protein [Oscillospiraceae bacterium]
MRNFDITDPLIRKLGRASENGELHHSASGVRVNAKCAELRLDVSAEYTTNEPWLAVLLNGTVIARFALPQGRSEIPLFRGMNAEAAKEVTVVRETQAMFGDCIVTVNGFSTEDGGELLPVRERALKIEVIGDSITSAEGAIGSFMEQDWIAAFFSAVNAYPWKLGEKLGADVRVISQSGFGVTCSWDGGKFGALPNFYGQSVLFRDEPHDFASWQPDAVVVNLGTNDSGGGADPDELQAAALAFLRQLRAHNPAAHIVWAVGMLGKPFVPQLEAAVAEFADNCSFLILPEQSFETMGARGHPGARNHEQAADVLAAHLRAIIPKLDQSIIAHSIAVQGNTQRLFRALKRAENDEKLTVVALGDSITAGSLATNNRGYVATLEATLKTRYPNAAVTVINAGYGATDSKYGAFRALRDVLVHNPDIVTVEFINDTDDALYLETYESLVRTLLNAPSAPAVVLLEMAFYDDLRYPDASHDPIARHYELPTVSVASAFRDSNIDRATLSPDGLHPNDLGHRYIAAFTERLFSLATDCGDYALPSPITANRYENGHIEPYRWRGEKRGDTTAFTIRGAVPTIAYMMFTVGGADAEITVDGETSVVSAKFPGGWGDFVALRTLTDAGGEHNVTVTLTDDGAFEILEIMGA